MNGFADHLETSAGFDFSVAKCHYGSKRTWQQRPESLLRARISVTSQDRLTVSGNERRNSTR
jgi:hypothetical protein